MGECMRREGVSGYPLGASVAMGNVCVPSLKYSPGPLTFDTTALTFILHNSDSSAVFLLSKKLDLQTF